MTFDAENPDYDEQIHAENAIASMQVTQYETYEQLFDAIMQACIANGKGIGAARLTTLDVLGTITGAKPPDNFGLPAETTDLF